MQRAMHDTVDEVARVTAPRASTATSPRAGTSTWRARSRRSRGSSELIAARPLVGVRRRGLRWLDRRRGAARLNAGRVPRRRLHAALRGDPPGPAGPRAGRGRRAVRHDDLRGHPRRRAHRPALRCQTGTVTADVVVRATEGFTPACPAAAHARPDLLADDRHRAAARLVLGRGRAGAPRDVQRRPPADHLRPAHGRRPPRLRRARRAVPLRLGDQAEFDRHARRARLAARDARRAVPRHRRRRRSPTAGVARSALPRDWCCSVGLDPTAGHGVGRRLRRRRGHARPTWPAARWPI